MIVRATAKGLYLEVGLPEPWLASRVEIPLDSVFPLPPPEPPAPPPP